MVPERKTWEKERIRQDARGENEEACKTGSEECKNLQG